MAKPEPLLNRETKPEAKPVSSAKAVSESPNGDDAKPDSDIEPTPGAKNVQEAAKAPGAEKAADTKKGATTLIESDPTTSPRNDALVDEQDTPEQTDESANKQAPDDVREDVVKEDVVGEDIAPPNEPRASEERLIPTSRLGGSARELLNDDGSLRKP